MTVSNAYMALISACILIGTGVYFLVLSTRIGKGRLRIPLKDPEKVLLVYGQLHIVSIVRLFFLIDLALGILVLLVTFIWPPPDIVGRLMSLLLPVLSVLVLIGGLDRFNRSYISYVEELASQRTC